MESGNFYRIFYFLRWRNRSDDRVVFADAETCDARFVIRNSASSVQLFNRRDSYQSLCYLDLHIGGSGDRFLAA